MKVLGVVVNGVTAGKAGSQYGGAGYDHTYGPDDYTGPEEQPAGGYYDDSSGEGKPSDAAVPKPSETAAPAESNRRRRSRQGVWRLPLLAWVLGWWA